MSEVSDALQIIVITGKCGYLVGRVSVKTAMSAVKLLNTIYLAKWKGSTSLNRLRKIKGEDLLFINVSSEEHRDLAKVEREMKMHGILFARMPDLCGGDGRTQYVISPGDAAKMKAMLLDHASGKNKDIRMGLISETDYMTTAINDRGEKTKELQELEQSASETAAKKQEKQRKQNKAMDPSETLLQEKPVVSGDPVLMKIHDLQTGGRDKEFCWIDRKPVTSTKDFSLFLMNDGQHVIAVPATDLITSAGKGKKDKQAGQMHHAAVFADTEYKVIGLSDQLIRPMTGKHAVELMQLPDVFEVNAELKKKVNAKQLEQMIQSLVGRKQTKEAKDRGRQL